MDSSSNPTIITTRNFDDLPDHVVIKIFENLSATERILVETVCKRWNCLAMDSWRKFYRLHSWSLAKYSGAIENMLSRCGMYLTTLEIVEYDADFSENIFSFIAQNCPNLEKFTLLFNLPPNLDVHLSIIFRNCQRLIVLDLSGNQNLTGSCFVDLPTELKCFCLTCCPHVENEHIRVFADRCSNLEELELSNCRQLTLDCLEFIFQLLAPQLRVLHLCNYRSFVQPSLALSYLTQLREIYLSSNRWVNDETLDLISRSCSYIKVIDVSSGVHITDMGLYYLLKLKKHLTHLNLIFCPKITDVGVKLLAELNNLQSLKLYHCRNITDDSVIKIVECCQNLIELGLSDTNITDASVLACRKKFSKIT